MQLSRKIECSDSSIESLLGKTFVVNQASSSNANHNDYFDVDLSSIDLWTSTLPAKAESAADGLVMSLNTYGKVDVEYIANLTGKSVVDVVNDLSGCIFQNPEKFNGDIISGWETADEYLSGNLDEKFRLARQYNRLYRGYFNGNIKALKDVMPQIVNLDEVHITIGAPWIPVSIMESFIRYTCNIREDDFLIHDENTGSWEIQNKSTLARCGDYTKINVTYGTYKINALQIIEKMLNLQPIKVTEEVRVNGKRKYVVNEKDTLLAQDREKKIAELFDRWILRDDKRRDELQQIYSKKYCRIRTRQFDGSFLTFPTLSKSTMLYPYQKNAIARILFSPNTLLAHDVGAGKTYIMVAAGAELKRMGISNKNMYVVPNNIVEQWSCIYKTMYPQANLLCVSPKNFTPAKRQETLAKMRDSDVDAIIIAYSCFSMIPMSNKFTELRYTEEIQKLKKSVDRGSATRAVKDRLKSLQKEFLEFIAKSHDEAHDISFDQLGVNTLFVDEAHNFKNLPFETRTGGVLGVNSAGSAKCQDMLEKVKCVQTQNNGRGVVFATGTPITNSLSDLFVLQKYLQSGIIENLNIGSFDAWIANFAELATGFEIDIDTSGYRMARRFSKFHNLTELTTILSLIADFHPAKCSSEMPDFNGYTDCMTEKTKALSVYISNISTRADDVRKRRVAPKDDNMLKITTDGRKAALDVRLVDPNAEFSLKSKMYQCAQKVKDVYSKYYKEGGTQLIFCDSSTPRPTFNAYDEMKRLLVKLGVKESEIAYVHDAVSDTQREKLFEMMRSSKIRVMLGSTWKLGIGVNVQDKLIAIHHLDVPWRPADMVQREGRILRPGNQCKEVFIFRYITKGTFDAYSWQLLETKQRFISKFLAGSLSQRNGKDVGDTVLNYAEVKALAIGNPILKERVETANELSKLLTLKNRREELRMDMMAQIAVLPNYIATKASEIEGCKKDIDFYNANKVKYNRDELKALGKNILEGLSNNDFEINEREVAEYQGFKIILPAGMLKSHPFVYVERDARYKLEYKITDIGIMMRLNNLLDGLDEHLKELETIKAKLEDKLSGLQIELEKEDPYSERIYTLQQKLKRIDKELGVKYGE